MGPEWLNSLLGWIEANPALAGLSIAAIAFLEGVALIGIAIPGIILLFGVGALVGLDVLSLQLAWFWASVGAITGDALSFWLGHHFKQELREIWPFSRFRNLIHRGERFFTDHGLKSVIIGRFLGPIRPIMPVVAGMMRMPLSRYVPASLVAAVLWAPVYLLPGVVFGASLELAQAVALRLALLLCLMLGLVWALVWIVQQSYLYLAPRTSRMLGLLMAWAHRHPVLGGPARALVDPSRPESGTLMVFALLLALATAGLLALLIAIPVAGGPLGWDQYVRTAMGRLRTPWADGLMAWLNGLGDVWVLFSASGAVFLWLWLRHRLLAAWHWAAAVGFGLLLAAIISYGVSISREAAQPWTPGESLPLMHVAVSAVIYGFFAVLIARELPRRRRMWPYALATLLVGLIGFARLYFGAHWLSDLLVGVFFGLLWVSILGLGYRTRIRRSFWMLPLALLFYAVVFCGATLYAINSTDRLRRAYAAVAPPTPVSASEWWANRWEADPQPGLGLNIYYAGELEALEAALLDRGWRRPPEAGWEMALEMIQPHPSPASLPLLPAAYQGNPDALLLHTVAQAVDQQWVVRIWPTTATLDGWPPIWVGLVARYRLERTAWFFSYWAADSRDREIALRRLENSLDEDFAHRRVDRAEGLLLLIAAGDQEDILLTAPTGIPAPDTPEVPASEAAPEGASQPGDNRPNSHRP